MEPYTLATRAEIVAHSLVLPGPPSPKVIGSGDRYKAPTPRKASGSVETRRADSSRVRIDGRRTTPEVPPRRARFSANVSQAPMVSLRCVSPAPTTSPRDYGMLRQASVRVHLGNNSLGPGTPEPRQGLVLVHKPDLRHLKAPVLTGNALRVSSGVTFRMGGVNLRNFRSRAPQNPELIWPRTPQTVSRESRDYASAARDLRLEIPRFAMRQPHSVNGSLRANLIYPGGIPPRNRKPLPGSEPGKRSQDINLKAQDPTTRGIAVIPEAAGFAKRNGARFFTLALHPTSTLGIKQVASTAFKPQEPKGVPKVAFEGTVAAAIVATPGAGGATDAPAAVKAAAPKVDPSQIVRIEEHFGEGWDNWMGGMEEWKVDVAGVRPGPLAVYVPTMELIDYDLEFLCRIDTRSVTWVVRAANLHEYLQCRLTALQGGELEFSRRAVVNGNVDDPVIAPTRLPGKPRTALTIGASISGDTFTITVDGNTIDSWTDDRFPMGGVGFTGAPDDRARLYWVRIASAELSAKEYQKT